MKYRTILVVVIVLSCIIACKRQPIGTFAYSIPANSAYSQITDKQMHDAITKCLHWAQQERQALLLLCVSSNLRLLPP